MKKYWSLKKELSSIKVKRLTNELMYLKKLIDSNDNTYLTVVHC